MLLVLILALAFIVSGALILAQALGLGQFVGRALVPNAVLGVVGSLFLGAGIAILWPALSGARSRASPNARVLRSSEDQGGILKLWVSSAFFLGIIGVRDYVFLWTARGHAAPWVWAVLGFFTLAGAGYLYVAVRKTLEWFKYGAIILYLDAPAETGQRLNARLKLPHALHPARTLTAKLVCVARVRGSSHNSRSTAESESEVWSETRSASIAWAGSTGQSQVHFDIPVSWPATDLPEEGALELNRAYHRWEIRIGADVPGIDLDRSFALHVARGKAPLPAAPVEIARRGAATASISAARSMTSAQRTGTGAAAPSMPGSAASPAGAPRRPSLMIETADIPKSWERPARLVAGIIGLVIMLWFFGVFDILRGVTGARKNQAPAAVAGPFEMAPDEYQQALRLFASGVKLERHGEDVHVRVARLRLLKVQSGAPVQYNELGAYLIHMPAGGQYRELSRWRNMDYRGALAAGKAEETLGPIEFAFKGAAGQCTGGECLLKLYAHVPLGPNSFRYENTAAVRFLFSASGDIAAADALPKNWESWIERALQPARAGRYAEAQRAYDEALEFVAARHGGRSAIYAMVLMRNAEIYQRQRLAAEEERRLTQALAILDAMDDAAIAAQVGPDWGQGSAIQELVPRRLGELYLAQGRFEDALARYRRAQQIVKRLGSKLAPYTMQVKTAENQSGIGASLCRLGRPADAAREYALAHAAARDMQRQMEERWERLFKGLRPGEDRVHRPNYEKEKASVAARLAKIENAQAQLKSGTCTSK